MVKHPEDVILLFPGERPGVGDRGSDPGRGHRGGGADHGQGWKESPSHHFRYFTAQSHYHYLILKQ